MKRGRVDIECRVDGVERVDILQEGETNEPHICYLLFFLCSFAYAIIF
jgi:hypothetical protein